MSNFSGVTDVSIATQTEENGRPKLVKRYNLADSGYNSVMVLYEQAMLEAVRLGIVVEERLIPSNAWYRTEHMIVVRPIGYDAPENIPTPANEDWILE